MVSRAKRLRYDSENYFNSSDESEDTNSNGENQNDLDVGLRRYQSRRKPKCFSKNAQMARENRLKKKIYVAKLEKEVHSLKSDNSKLSDIINNQSFMLTELKNEVKYLKAVLANSSDISKLLNNIHQSTGMSVSTSLNKSLNITNNSKMAPVPIARKTMHPWEEKARSNLLESSDTPSDIFPDEFSHGLELDFPLNDENDLSQFLMDETDLPMGLEENEESICVSTHEEHNYTRALAPSKYLEGLQIYLPILFHQFKFQCRYPEAVKAVNVIN